MADADLERARRKVGDVLRSTLDGTVWRVYEISEKWETVTLGPIAGFGEAYVVPANTVATYYKRVDDRR